jgi:hypothetical protein
VTGQELPEVGIGKTVSRRASRGRGEEGNRRRYAAGIAIEIFSTLVLMAIAFLIAAAGCLLWP